MSMSMPMPTPAKTKTPNDRIKKISAPSAPLREQNYFTQMRTESSADGAEAWRGQIRSYCTCRLDSLTVKRAPDRLIAFRQT